MATAWRCGFGSPSGFTTRTSPSKSKASFYKSFTAGPRKTGPFEVEGVIPENENRQPLAVTLDEGNPFPRQAWMAFALRLALWNTWPPGSTRFGFEHFARWSSMKVTEHPVLGTEGPVSPDGAGVKRRRPVTAHQTGPSKGPKSSNRGS